MHRFSKVPDQLTLEMCSQLTNIDTYNRQLRNAQPVRVSTALGERNRRAEHSQASARRQISSSSEALKPASAAAQVARPVVQRYTPVPSYPRDTGSIPGATRDTLGLGVDSGLPQVGHDERRVSVGWKNGSRSRL